MNEHHPGFVNAAALALLCQAGAVWGQVPNPGAMLELPGSGFGVLPAGIQQPAPPVKPEILLRKEWDAKASTGLDPDELARVRVVVHHTEGFVTDAWRKAGRAAAAEQMRAIQAFHKNTRGWSDIGYHYVIDWEGNIWQGRPLYARGAHSEDNNEGSIGVALMGDFDKQSPTAEQLASLERMLLWLAWQYRIDPEHIQGHHHWNATSCPGKNLEREQREEDPRNPSLLRLLRLRLIETLRRLPPRPAGKTAPTKTPSLAPATSDSLRGVDGLMRLISKTPTAAGSNLRFFYDRGTDEGAVPEAVLTTARLFTPPNTTAAVSLYLPSLQPAGGDTLKNRPITPIPGSHDPAPVLSRDGMLPGHDAAGDPIDDGKYHIPFESQKWPGVSKGGHYGAPREYGRHSGIDFPLPEGTPVYASRVGVVTRVDDRVKTTRGGKGYGNRVIVEHPDGTETWYCHLYPNSITVKVGDTVAPFDPSRAGNQMLGKLGSTGHSTGPHLHFMVLDAQGAAKNPAVALGHKKGS